MFEGFLNIFCITNKKNEPRPSTWLEILRETFLKLFPFESKQFRKLVFKLFCVAFEVKAIKKFNKSIVKTSEFFHNELPLPWRRLLASGAPVS